MTPATGTIGNTFRAAVAAVATQGNPPGAEIFLDVRDNRPTVRSFAAQRAAVEFPKHERKWKRDTKYVSSLSEKYLHPSYARIIGLGWPAIPFILKSLKKETDDWFYALRAITGTNVVPSPAAGNMEKMGELWLKWGAARGLIEDNGTKA